MSDDSVQEVHLNTTVSSLPKRPLIDIEFQDLTYSVPDGRKGTKIILRNISGQFGSGQLNAILGPSGAGKSTLLNILAGYKCQGATGSILINGQQRNMKQFRTISRYIMQEDLIQPMLTVDEIMMLAANLKLNRNMPRCDKLNAINDILELLRLKGTKNTCTNRLSGGEKKRLSIALELLNNPPVIFLDEPTTGLDDLSCSQCISLLKLLAEGGRTVICSIHTPSARLFSMFDNVYILSNGSCTYQGYGPSVVPFLSNLDIVCPKHYNPADFIIEVCCGEYGDYQDKMVSAMDNGRNLTYCKMVSAFTEHIALEADDKDNEIVSRKEHIDGDVCSKEDRNLRWDQFQILLMRMWLQMWRDKSYLLLKVVLHICIGLLIGNLYIGMGKDGAKTIFNFGFLFTCIIFFMYVPMMPVLLQFPTEVQYLKREHFNKWYSLSSHFFAMAVASLPIQIILGIFYLTMVYFISDQPFELNRLVPFYAICILTSIISESFGLLISTTLNIVNATFVGPVLTVPLMLLATYGFGSGYDSIPLLIKIAMHFSYLRYSMEALVHVMMKGRPKLHCPEEEDLCFFTNLDDFIRVMGMEHAIIWVDVVALFSFLIIIRGTSYYLLRQRLSPNRAFVALQYIGRFVKAQFSIGR